MYINAVSLTDKYYKSNLTLQLLINTLSVFYLKNI